MVANVMTKDNPHLPAFDFSINLSQMFKLSEKCPPILNSVQSAAFQVGPHTVYVEVSMIL